MTDGLRLDGPSEGVLELVLDRPKKLNAITPKMAEAIRDSRRRINDDPAIRCVLIRGEGERAFCAGTDLHSLDDYEDAWAWRQRICYATEIRKIEKPVVAAVHGYAFGGGLEIALNSDIRIASPDTVIAAPEVTHGWLGAGGMTQMLTRLCGYGVAMLINLSGDRFSAEQAQKFGVFEIVDEDWLGIARGLATRIAGHDPIATMTIKEGIRAAMRTGLDSGSRHENDLMVMAFALGNQRRGVDAFAKRDRSNDGSE